eukprot:6196334-Pleurochrysis_carterae.AAC.5
MRSQSGACISRRRRSAPSRPHAACSHRSSSTRARIPAMAAAAALASVAAYDALNGFTRADGVSSSSSAISTRRMTFSCSAACAQSVSGEVSTNTVATASSHQLFACAPSGRHWPWRSSSEPWLDKRVNNDTDERR